MSVECPFSGQPLVLITCRDCNGSGYGMEDRTCEFCGGHGEVWEHESEVEEHERKKY